MPLYKTPGLSSSSLDIVQISACCLGLSAEGHELERMVAGHDGTDPGDGERDDHPA